MKFNPMILVAGLLGAFGPLGPITARGPSKRSTAKDLVKGDLKEVKVAEPNYRTKGLKTWTARKRIRYTKGAKS